MLPERLFIWIVEDSLTCYLLYCVCTNLATLKKNRCSGQTNETKALSVRQTLSAIACLYLILSVLFLTFFSILSEEAKKKVFASAERDLAKFPEWQAARSTRINFFLNLFTHFLKYSYRPSSCFLNFLKTHKLTKFINCCIYLSQMFGRVKLLPPLAYYGICRYTTYSFLQQL